MKRILLHVHIANPKPFFALPMSSTAFRPDPQESTCTFAAIGPDVMHMSLHITEINDPWADWQMGVFATSAFWHIKHWKNTGS